MLDSGYRVLRATRRTWSSTKALVAYAILDETTTSMEHVQILANARTITNEVYRACETGLAVHPCSGISLQKLVICSRSLRKKIPYFGESSNRSIPFSKGVLRQGWCFSMRQDSFINDIPSGLVIVHTARI